MTNNEKRNERTENAASAAAAVPLRAGFADSAASAAAARLAAAEKWLAATGPEDILLALGGAVLLALFPLARGGWDLWAQAAFEVPLFGGAALWCAVKLLRGRLPRFGPGAALAACVLAAAFVSCWLAPVGWVSWRAFKWLAAGLAVFVFAPFAGSAGRKAGLVFLVSTGWFLCLLAGYQFLRGGDVTGSYFNPNAFSGLLVMLAPFALLGGYAVSGAVFAGTIALAGGRGAGAALLITAALFLACRAGKRAKAAAALAALGAGLWIYFADFSSLQHRLGWWSSAWQMFTLRPLTGFGGGVFEYIFPAVHDVSRFRIGSLYAHSWPLELLSEYGAAGFVPLAALTVRQIYRAQAPQKWAAVAALVLSAQDYTLSVPANFAVFCFLLSSGERAAAEDCGAVFPRGLRLCCAGAVLAAGFGICAAVANEFTAEKEYLAAARLYRAGDAAGAVACAERLAAREPRYPAPRLLIARARRAQAEREHNLPLLLAAAVSYERALELHPYHILAYDELAGIYRMTGNGRALAGLAARR
ncbi:MAG: O-antigen ligase family protein, partial [Elusimicrobiaceae bacterium]|nr:O-antigen ligase family protein [Elusimicrobiaceae bacterium]